VPELASETAAGRWRSDYYDYENVGFEIEGSTVGLVGFGAVGRRVASALNALGADVLVHDPFVPADQLGPEVTVVGLDDLLSRSRIVSLHARATKENSGMIDARRLALMPAGAVLVNCARGSLVNEDAVAEALNSGRLFGAAFDVFEREPIPPGSVLLGEPHFIGTPHVAGASREVAHKAARIMAAEVGRFCRGDQLAHCVNPSAVRSS
jgi:D-3-phosphoglycerate dehydrogenase